jgi:saxitoxin biosynthesis operon SxtJ-like protein
MALIDRDREPSSTELRNFGILLASFCGLLGGLVVYHTGSWSSASFIWGAGALVSVFYYTLPATQYLVFRSWTTAVYPIGWIISHALLAAVYYMVITPIGLALRLWNRDQLQLKLSPSSSTYWIPHTAPKGIGQYFQQF